MTEMMTAGLLSNSLTPEQRRKFRLEEEKMDRRGVVRRYRVSDQTIFDALLVDEFIAQPQHEAADCFMETMERTGCYPSSISEFEATSRTPAYAVGGAMGQRWMAFSRAYRFLERASGKTAAKYMMKIMSDVYGWRETVGINRLSEVGERVSAPLLALAEYYGCAREDPRMLVRVLLNQK